MQYNEKYKCWVSKEGILFKVVDDKLVPIHVSKLKDYEKTSRGFVHRIVAETFIGEIPYGYEVDHINDDPSDNRLVNLQIITRAENNNKPSHIHKLRLKQLGVQSPNKGKKFNKVTRKYE